MSAARSAAIPRSERGVIGPYALLLTTTLLMLVTGLVMILSASSVESFKLYGSSFLYFNKQMLGATIGVVSMFVFSRIDHRSLRRFVGPLLAGTIVLLVMVLIPGIGASRGGSSRWIPLGMFNLQPSELAKLTVIFYAAHVLERKGHRVRDAQEMALPLLPVVGIIGLLVVLQPDLGTSIVCAAAAFVVLYLSGARGSHLGMLAGAGALCVTALALSAGYRYARLKSFLDPWADPLNTGYQNIQGQIALGSGGWFGLGLGASRQKWSYIPNAHTDFIYAIVGEELGLAGTLSILVMLGLFLYAGVRVARRAPDRFGFLLAGGITGWIGVQALINVAAVTGVLPITGVPLPLISFGGSSLVFTLSGIGVLLSIARRARV